jgi:uncharacterized protein YdaU (DUF1376 family)
MEWKEFISLEGIALLILMHAWATNIPCAEKITMSCAVSIHVA